MGLKVLVWIDDLPLLLDENGTFRTNATQSLVLSDDLTSLVRLVRVFSDLFRLLLSVPSPKLLN